MGASSSRHRAIAGLTLDIKAARESMPAANRPIVWGREESVVAHCIANTLENMYFHTLTGARRSVARPAVAGLTCLRVRHSVARVAFSPEPPADIPCYCVGAVSTMSPSSSVQGGEGVFLRVRLPSVRAVCAEDKVGDLCSSASAENGDDEFVDLCNSASWWPVANEYDVAGRTWPPLREASGFGHQEKGSNAIANAQPNAIQCTESALSAAGTHSQKSSLLELCTAMYVFPEFQKFSKIDTYI